MARGDSGKPCGLENYCPYKDKEICKTEPRLKCPFVNDYIEPAKSKLKLLVLNKAKPQSSLFSHEEWQPAGNGVGSKDSNYWWCRWLAIEKQKKNIFPDPILPRVASQYAITFRCDNYLAYSKYKNKEEIMASRWGSFFDFGSGNPHDFESIGKIQFAECLYKNGDNCESPTVKTEKQWLFPSSKKSPPDMYPPGKAWPLTPREPFFSKGVSNISKNDLNDILNKVSDTKDEALLKMLESDEYAGKFFHVYDVLDNNIGNQVAEIIATLFYNWVIAVELQRLRGLLCYGVLTQEKFDAKKNHLLGLECEACGAKLSP